MSFLRARRPMLVTTLLGLSMVAAGCGIGGSGHSTDGLGAGPGKGASHGVTTPALEPSAVVKTNVARGATDVPVDHRVQVRRRTAA